MAALPRTGGDLGCRLFCFSQLELASPAHGGPAKQQFEPSTTIQIHRGAARKPVRIPVMKIALGADHAGFELKQKIKNHLIAEGVQVDDRGTVSNESVDYPDFARLVGEEVAQRQADLGILVCGSGVGMAMAANKVPGIRAANVTTEYEAQMSREHNDANVLALGGRVLNEQQAMKIVDLWLHTPFAGGRHQRRVDKIMQIEQEECANAAERKR